VVTKDGMPSVHVEHTLALTQNGVEIVTRDEELPPIPATPSAF
jgi:methionyl aminopeptidase